MSVTLTPNVTAERQPLDSDDEIRMSATKRSVGFETVRTPLGLREAGLTPVTDGRPPVIDGLTPGSRGRGSWLRSSERSSVRVGDALSADRVVTSGDRSTTVSSTHHVSSSNTDLNMRDRLLLDMAAELAEIRCALDCRTPSSGGRSLPVIPVEGATAASVGLGAQAASGPASARPVEPVAEPVVPVAGAMEASVGLAAQVAGSPRQLD